MGEHRHGHKHDHRGRHGNPEDLAEYVTKLEGPERDEWQKPDEVIAALGLKPDSVVCDTGAGTGYFALRMPCTVYAIEVEPQMAKVLLQRIRERKARHVTPVLALSDDPLLPDACCDVALIVDTFHHFEDGVAYLRRLTRALRPGGRIVNIDFHARELPVGPSPDRKIDRDAFLSVASAAGLRLVKEHTFLPYQYFLELSP